MSLSQDIIEYVLTSLINKLRVDCSSEYLFHKCSTYLISLLSLVGSLLNSAIAITVTTKAAPTAQKGSLKPPSSAIAPPKVGPKDIPIPYNASDND